MRKGGLTEKIFEGVEVIVSWGARTIEICIFLLVLFTGLRIEDVDSSCFKRWTPTIEGEEKREKN